MRQSEFPAPPLPPERSGLHVAAIMDGSGRWAERRGWPRAAGHRAGAEAVRRVVRAAPAAGVGTLTLFAFSAANWRRPAAEAAVLMDIFKDYLEGDRGAHLAEGVRVSVIGRRDRLPQGLVAAIERAERATARGARLNLRLAIDYSAREALVETARRSRLDAPAEGRSGARSGCDFGAENFARTLAEVIHDPAPAPDVDLLIRTGGEQRLSDCLLWEGAFAEIVFIDRLWPDFGAADLGAALAEFHRRERRFGGVVETAAS
ncbi:MAG TPA: polyprenyl diphosphate synthase [Terriglobia bacterium]|nr:polyprenyl diphosphate synthase [Terriglobia bacterium]